MQSASFNEWLGLFVRWMHVIAGIMWIGSSLFFNWLDSHLSEPAVAKKGVEGELWMVHSGGFYQVEKKLVAPEQMPAKLHWFKWEAAFTWISGFFLLCLVFYTGGGIYLVDPNVSSISPAAATVLGIGLLIVSWVIYDLLWASPLAESPKLAIVLSVAGAIAISYGLTQVLSGRAAYIHVGAMLGTVMVGNVWMRIIPAQRHLVAATMEGRKPDPVYGKKAKQRSRHNNYMTYPVIFIMLSNHYPATYGSMKLNWLILAVLMIAGATVRHFQNTGDRSPRMLLGGVGLAAALATVVSVVGSLGGTAQPDHSGAAPAAAGDAAPVATSGTSRGGPAYDSPLASEATAGIIHAVALFEGAAPAPKEVAIPANCAPDQQGKVYSNSVLVSGGRLQNVFVSISKGIDKWSNPPPAKEVVVMQRGCVYEPRVLGAQVGQLVTFVNGDPVFHNVHTVADANAAFNEGMPGKDQRLTKTFDKPEVMVHSKCDVHPWMSAYIGVLPHPYFAVSNARGEVQLDRVPPGTYTVDAWHEVYGKQSRTVTVTAKGTVEAQFQFKAE